MSKYVDISEKVTATFYDEEHEEWTKRTVTIEDVLDSVCDDYTILPSADASLMQDRCKYDASSELISRQDAIDAMEQAKEQYFDRRVIIGKMQDIVNNLPSADAEMNSKLFRIGEVLVEVSKEHITAEQGVKKIGVIMRGYDI